MKRLTVALLGLLLGAGLAEAQIGTPGGPTTSGLWTTTSYGAGAPAGACALNRQYVDTGTGALYVCAAGTWTDVTAASAFAGSFTIAGATITTPILNLADGTGTWLQFADVVTPANVISFAQDTTAPSTTTTVTDGTATVSVAENTGASASRVVTVDDPGNSATVTRTDNMSTPEATLQAVFGTYTFLDKVNGDTNTTTRSVTDGTNTISVVDAWSAPSKTTTVTDGTNTNAITDSAVEHTADVTDGTLDARVQATISGGAAATALLAGNGVTAGFVSVTTRGAFVSAAFQETSYNPAQSLVQGGYTLDGTTTASPASTVTITLADPEADTTPASDVLVCGYEDTASQAEALKSCETVASTEAGPNVTATSFIEITEIKSYNAATNDADDTIAAEFTTGAVSILGAVTLADSTKSVFDGTTAAAGENSGNLIVMNCLDPAGCDFTLSEVGMAGYPGRELTIVLATATENVVFVDIDGQMEMAGDANDTLDGDDVIRFIYNGSAWLQVSLSEN